MVKITRYEKIRLLQEIENGGQSNVEKILKFYNDMMYFKNNPEKVIELKNTIAEQKKKEKEEPKKLDAFMLVSDDEN